MATQAVLYSCDANDLGSVYSTTCGSLNLKPSSNTSCNMMVTPGW